MTDPASDVEQAVYVQRIDPEHKQEYVEAHDDIPADVVAAMERGGVQQFDLYVHDNIAVCVVEAEDLNEYVDAVTGDPSVEEWERHVAQFKCDGVDVDASENDQIPFMDRIWSLEN